MTTFTLRRRAAAVAVAGALAVTGVATTTASAAPVLSVDFENGSWAPLVQSGSPTLSVAAIDGDNALVVANRTADYVGVSTPAALLTPGVAYTASVDIKLAPGTAATSARLVGVPGYSWIGNSAVSADGWTTLTGTWTASGSASEQPRIYVGTGDLSPAAPYTYYLDNFTITSPDTGGGTTPPGGATNPSTTPSSAAQGTGNRVALTFDDGPNPGETETLLDVLKAQGIEATFCVIGSNIQAPGGADILRRIVAEGHTLCNHSTSYADMGAMTADQARADLVANLKIIRDALGDPDHPVPYFRAPNGSWGNTPAVAVELGMQPLGLGNLINDWTNPQDGVAVLEARLRAAMQPGAIVLGHDGGGDRTNTVQAFANVLPDYAAWDFTLPVVGTSTPPTTTSPLSNDFEEELAPWAVRGSGDATATPSTEAHAGTQAALVSGRTNAWNGLGAPVAGVLQPGATYELSAYVKLPAGTTGTADVRVSVQRDVPDGTADKWVTLHTVTGVGANQWTQVAFTFSAPQNPELLYFETSSGTLDFLVDDIVVRAPSGTVQDLTPMKDIVPFPLGAAIDERETTGAAAELLLRHHDQITAENHMKVEAWYEGPWNFRTHPQATALMSFAAANDLRLYGHVLVWHSQTPDWFFTDAAGAPLTTSAADQQIMRDRMRTHIFNVAEALATEHGLFGSDTNPLVAFDVVNEVISDDRQDDGLRRSEWYRILGESYIDLAFQYADEAFNQTYAAPGTDRPVTLFINDYNTEQGGKQDRYYALVQRLLGRGVPVDGVGHQFHVSLSMPVSALAAAIDRFADLPVTQAVTELDVTVGSPVTEANIIEQGFYYRDAFREFRARADELFSVTLWGLTDGRSWRASGAPLAFTDTLQAKPAYYGIVDSDALPGRIRTANVFAGTAPLTAASLDAVMWDALPLIGIEDKGSFQLRWAPDHLTAYVRVSDATPGAGDSVSFTVGDQMITVPRTGATGAVVREVPGGYEVLAHLPATAEPGNQVQFDARISDGGTAAGWNTPGYLGTLTLVEELSFTTVPEAASDPAIDGTRDAAWDAATAVRTDKVLSGGDGAAKADVSLLWRDGTLFIYAEVADETIDTSASDPWNQDSVEIFLNPGNTKAGPYGALDSQMRISVDNQTSFGTGDEAAQDARLTSATRRTEAGYVVEAAITIGEPGEFHGLDFQVNDGTGGARTGVTSWADPTGLGYQSTARWGVAQLVEAPVVTPTPTPTVTVTPRPTASDHYSIPGFHYVGGRHWFTRCEPYSRTVRCRTEIWATQVVVEGGRYVRKSGWFFNNLTYLPLMTRAEWGASHLANTGTYTIAGRQWRTECDTPATGRSNCRSWIKATFVASERLSNGTYRYFQKTDWVFNNIVRFKV